MFKKSEHKVYKLRTIDKTVIYVGRTGRSVQERFSEHLRDKFWISEVEEVEECYIGSESDASITENIYINKLKPIFNKKDKFTGHTKTKPEPAFKKFSHSFYVFNKKITTCVPTFEEGYTLVDVIKINGKDVGVYYDECLNPYFSATDLASALNIDKKTFRNVNKDLLKKVSYEIMNLGRRKMLTSSLCNIEGVKEISRLCSNEIVGRAAYKQLYNIYKKSDMVYMYGNHATAETVKEDFLYAMIALPDDRYNDSHTKRRLAYKSNTQDIPMQDVVFEFNQSISKYLERVELESFSCEIFGMIEDIVVEHSTEYRYVSDTFIKKLKEKGINMFKIKGSIAKQYKMNPKDITLHFAVSARRDELYDDFMDFYNECIS